MTEVVVLTGAAHGIGLAVAQSQIERYQRTVVGVDWDARALAAAAQQLGDRFLPREGDVSERQTHEQAAGAAEQAGTLTAWVNCAGVEAPGRAHDFTDDDLHRSLSINLMGPAFGCATAIRSFLRNGVAGSIVNVSSLKAIASFPNSFPFEAAKAGVNAITRQIAIDYGAMGIRANAVLPGAIMTPLAERVLARAPDQEAELASWIALHPLNRLGEPAEVAAVIGFLLSEDAAFVSGVCLPIDGAASARCFAYPPEHHDLTGQPTPEPQPQRRRAR